MSSLSKFGVSVLKRSGVVCLPKLSPSSSSVAVRCMSDKPETFAQKKHKVSTPLLEKFDALKPHRDWVSWGHHSEDIEQDRSGVHLYFFLIFTLVGGGVGWYFFYCPHKNFKDWAQREAYIRMAECDRKGLTYIDPNLVALDRIVLPTDEELGSTEIII